MSRGGSRESSRASAERPDPWEVALRLLAMRAMSTEELRQRLARRGYAADPIASVVARLTASRYLDDAEYARTWARSRAHRRSLGPARLARELRARGIAELEISATLDEVFGERDVRSVAEAAAIRKLRDLQGVPPLVARRRLAAFLTRRGFPAEIILALCRKHCPQGEDLNDQ
ncbi:MAG: regulatory protein RecX [candidate division NC10 bacterium]|nr:regulatory protein RecX [candidate division NC10 bacterium]